MQGVNSAGGLKKLLLDYNYATKQQGWWMGSLGGRVQLMVTGSATTSPAVKEFLKIAFACCVEEGYALTDSTLSFTMLEMSTGNQIGIPLPKMQIRLADVPELNLCRRGARAVKYVSEAPTAFFL
ncbi:Aste57867_9915 [Aphanomyces stellatus]|uniref:Aste57867_9915 protein n=1 Tax=Aphanomyces stellatus TaxID=120398 RepID=A0A485KP29_9STRA|nr:hypothetical protein As57867_009876 [Aphanomyces stellatus]VFT86793.1 Aste57867_9915 [Aphanomyces stellatus]